MFLTNSKRVKQFKHIMLFPSTSLFIMFEDGDDDDDLVFNDQISANLLRST